MATIPSSVIESFYTSKTTYIELKSGLINKTFLINEGSEKSILQQVSTVFDQDSINDSKECAQLFADFEWESPLVLPTLKGSNFVTDSSGNLWRKLRFIMSDGRPPRNLDIETLYCLGRLLARWHATAESFNFKPSFSLPHFHDVAWHAEKLKRSVSNLSETEQRFAEQLVSAYEALPHLPEVSSQLLHGDPQVNNFLYRKHQPFTLIDLDGVMTGPIWYDIGDLLRSVHETNLLSKSTRVTCATDIVIRGYYTFSSKVLGKAAFFRTAKRATQLIALELAMRFLNDIVDDCYFTWDSVRFKTRAENHLYRAKLQWQIYMLIDKELEHA